MKKLIAIFAGLFLTQLTVQAQQEIPELYKFDKKKQIKALKQRMLSSALSDQNIAARGNSTNTRVIGVSNYLESSGMLVREDSSALSYSNSSQVSTYDYLSSFGYDLEGYRPASLVLVSPLTVVTNTEFAALDYYRKNDTGGDTLVMKRGRTYRPGNQLSEGVIQIDVGMGFMDYSKTLYTYDASGKISEIRELMWNGFRFDTVAVSKFQYNSAGQYIKDELRYSYMGYTSFSKTEIDWNGSNPEAARVYEKNVESQPWEISSRITLTYSNARLTSLLEEVADGSNWTDLARIDLTYNSSNLLATRHEHFFYKDDNAWVKEFGLTYSYNSNNNVSSVTISSLQEDVLEDLFTGITYNSDNLPVSRVESYAPDLSNPFFEQRYYYETVTSLNELGSKVQSLNLYPNPVSGALNLGGDADYKSYHILNLAGQVIESGNLGRNSHQLTVSLLPVGNYVLQLIDVKGQRYAAPFIKQ